MRKQNLSVHDISRELARDGESLHPAAIAAILKVEGFAKLPRRFDDERPDQSRPVIAEIADVRELDLTPRSFPHQVRRPVPVPPMAEVCRPGQAPGPGSISPGRRWSRRLRSTIAAGH